jgi:hypothetical protein
MTLMLSLDLSARRKEGWQPSGMVIGILLQAYSTGRRGRSCEEVKGEDERT